MGDGLMACCIQHEMDHLNGVLFVDRVTDEEKLLEGLKKGLNARRPHHRLSHCYADETPGGTLPLACVLVLPPPDRCLVGLRRPRLGVTATGTILGLSLPGTWISLRPGDPDQQAGLRD